MATTLEQKLNLILNEKQTKILPENIKKGVNYFDIEGTLEAGGIDTSDATAKTTDIVKGKTAYVNGEKITGTIQEIGGSIYSADTVWVDNDLNTLMMQDDSRNYDAVIRSNGGLGIGANVDVVAKAIDLTGDKIIKGQTILGVEGTAEAGGSQYEEIKLSELQVGDSIIGIRVKYKPTEVTDETLPVFEEVQGKMNGLIWMGVDSDGENSNRLVFSCCAALGGTYCGCYSELFKRVDSSWTPLSTSELHILTSPLPIGYINPTDIPKLDNCISIIKVK